jgi:2-polyprenyl-3-methyl-5-hydroxy-6-metoxy-1,4-benzoquinol methylase
MRFPNNVTVESVLERPLEEFAAASFDVILALDVLEHVRDLPGTVHHLVRLLRPGGQLIVSGPTENVAYRLGRKFAGSEYSGDYHVRDIYQIRAALERIATVRTLATLYYPVPLFQIYCVTPTSSTLDAAERH